MAWKTKFAMAAYASKEPIWKRIDVSRFCFKDDKDSWWILEFDGEFIKNTKIQFKCWGSKQWIVYREIDLTICKGWWNLVSCTISEFDIVLPRSDKERLFWINISSRHTQGKSPYRATIKDRSIKWHSEQWTTLFELNALNQEPIKPKNDSESIHGKNRHKYFALIQDRASNKTTGP